MGHDKTKGMGTKEESEQKGWEVKEWEQKSSQNKRDISDVSDVSVYLQASSTYSPL